LAFVSYGGWRVRPTDGDAGNLLAISDLHIGYAENRALVENIRPGTDRDWLLHLTKEQP